MQQTQQPVASQTETLSVPEAAGELFNPILYTRGVDSDCFTLVLSGKVNVCSGNEGFMIMQSAFNYLGSEALVRDDYRPDFSAKVIESARILRITRQQYRQALSSYKQRKSYSIPSPNRAFLPLQSPN